MTSFFDEIQHLCAANSAPAAETLEDILADGVDVPQQMNVMNANTLILPTLREPIQALVSQPRWAHTQPPTIGGYFIPTDLGTHLADIHQAPPVQEEPKQQLAVAFKGPSKKRRAPEDASGDLATKKAYGKRAGRGQQKPRKAAAAPIRTSVRRKEQQEQAQMGAILERFGRYDPRYRFFIHSVIYLAVEHSIDLSTLEAPLTSATIAELLHQTVISLELLPKRVRPRAISTATAYAEKELLELPLAEGLQRAQVTLCVAQFIYTESRKQREEGAEIYPECGMDTRRVRAAMGEGEDEDEPQNPYTQQQQKQQVQVQQEQVLPAVFVKQPWKDFVPI